MHISAQTDLDSGSVNGSLHQQSSPRESVAGTRLEGAQWDILQNLVANTRSQGSAAATLPDPAVRPRGPQVVDRTQPLVRPAPAQWQCVSRLTQAGPSAGRRRWQKWWSGPPSPGGRHGMLDRTNL